MPPSRWVSALMAIYGACAFDGTNKNQMNVGFDYLIANALNKTEARSFRGEFFEVYGPVVKTRYGDVSWFQQPVDLPADIVKRFDGKVMAVTGYEVDILQLLDNGTMRSAPCYELYNHHYSGWMHGKQASRIADPEPGADTSNSSQPIVYAHGQPVPRWNIEPTGDPNHDRFPSVQAFSEGNGNEHRRSFKGYPQGYAQLILSPQTWANNPMIIDTNKRLTGDKSPGPINHELVPRGSIAPPDSTYSGILECPCTDRIVKVVDGYSLLFKGAACSGGSQIKTVEECDAAAVQMDLSPVSQNATRVSSPDLPPGCSAKIVDGAWVLSLNTAQDDAAGAECGAAGKTGSNMVGAVDTSVGLRVGLELENDKSGDAYITFIAPASGGWFAVGFNATRMSDLPYAIVLQGDGEVSERKLGQHAAGKELSRTVEVVSNTVTEGVRTVVMRRPLTAPAPDYFTFDSSADELNVIVAGGPGAEMAYHGPNRTGARITFTRQGGSGVCLCRDPKAVSGTIGGVRFEPDSFCAPFPTGELLSKKNAICNISEYGGGLFCCRNGAVLLDKDQEQPNETESWRMKYRFYFEDYTSQLNLYRAWWSTEAYDNEYDVPKSPYDCLDSTTPAENCTYTIRSNFTGFDLVAGRSACMVSGDPNGCANVTEIAEQGGTFKLLYAAAHCHTPGCMSAERWNMDTGELICVNEPEYGSGAAAYDEHAYLVGIPPCVWGTQAEGLRPPPVLSLDSNLTTIKRVNNTNGHWGVMGMWQSRVAYA